MGIEMGWGRVEMGRGWVEMGRRWVGRGRYVERGRGNRKGIVMPWFINL